MARVASRRTPSSGYKFTCQACDDEVYQGAQPELIFHLQRERGVTISTAVQACIDCAEEIREENATYNKKYKPSERQVRELRPATELEASIPAAGSAQSSSADAKLDKVLDAIAGLTQLMTLQLQSQMVSKPATIQTEKQEIPEPKRKILVAPVKTSAKSKAAKPKNAAKKPTSKPKPRGRK